MSKRALIVVLGDFERSPRMRYHSNSLLELGYAVDVIAYLNTPARECSSESENFNIYPIKEVKSSQGLPRFLAYVWKTLLLAWTLFISLCKLPNKPDVILTQNPPSLPSLPVIWFYCLLKKVAFIIDWHNYGFTILQMANDKSLLVKIHQWAEGHFGSKSSANLCVSQAMKRDLEHRWGLNAHVFYDFAPSDFKPLNNDEKFQFLSYLTNSYHNIYGDIFTNKIETLTTGNSSMRTAIILTSTSWTEDEDFSVLYDALIEYDKGYSVDEITSLILVITGKGPLKEMHVEKISHHDWHHIRFVFPWLEAKDYPKMVACADLGISLHKSSSGLDLPMKVSDMIGCGVPVLAYDYECQHEQIGNAGSVYSSSAELVALIINYLIPFPENETLKKSRQFVIEHRLFWNEEWLKIVAPIIDAQSSGAHCIKS